MFGAFEYIAAAVAVASISWGSYNAFNAKTYELEATNARVKLAEVRGSLTSCTNRIDHIRNARESNAEIPDDLLEFDVPSEWLLGEDEVDTDS